ncbi:hypothetical protein [Sphingopyxis flava]|uniref:Uncharacterized protein n=1 Tax=Sphingopyxis flava TaxID=1507287 RepID=A0A1T5F6T2_9SPHN|nr:hypothetical protein [Sphingopyxis flava]SKB91886.1 hypothetical protein SAMN06295937_102931 [Sphingopyxis flava]
MRRELNERANLYFKVTSKVIAELEEERLPWLQPWDRAAWLAVLRCDERAIFRAAGLAIRTRVSLLAFAGAEP